MSSEEVQNEFKAFLNGRKLPEDFKLYDLNEWENYALLYLMHNWDHAVDDKFDETELNDSLVECAGCGDDINPGEGLACHLKPNFYHRGECWENHLGECIEEN